MAVEIEVKILEIDPVEVGSRLEVLGAQRVATGRMATAVYDYPDRRYISNDAYVRVRNTETGAVEMTYKARRVVDGMKVADEIEFEISDYAAGEAFLRQLGLERVSLLEKDRTKWRLEGDIEIVLDVWPSIPAYIEVEAPTRERVLEGLALLGIDADRANTMSQAEVLGHYGIDLVKTPEVRFETSDRR